MKIFFLVVFVVGCLLAIIYLSMLVTEKVIIKKFKEKIKNPFEYILSNIEHEGNRTNFFNLCDASYLKDNFLFSRDVGDRAVALVNKMEKSNSSNRAYDYDTAHALSWLCNNVSALNCLGGGEALQRSVAPDIARYVQQSSEVRAIVPFIVNDKTLYGMLFHVRSTVVLIWSGTVTLPMWEKDFQFQLTPFAAATTATATTMAKKNSGSVAISKNDPKVHTGFLSIYSSFEDAIKRYVARNRKGIRNIIVAGHSLGGGVTSICVCDLLLHLKNDSSFNFVAYTFGAPKPGNVSFSNFFEQEATNNKKNFSFFRVANSEDAIASVPLYDDYAVASSDKNDENSDSLYCHVEGVCTVAFTKSLGSFVRNHIDAYLYHLPSSAALKKCVAQ